MPDSSGMTVLDDLPEWLVVDEILARLPPKAVLRCRAVRKSWLSSTSTDVFILNHHRRQPSLLIIRHGEGICCLAVLSDAHAGTRPSNDQKIRPILLYADPIPISVIHHAACDGLLSLSYQSNFYICNPAIRKCASLPHPPLRPGISVANVVGFYRLHTSGEYRVLWVLYSIPMRGDITVDDPEYFVLTVGSDQPRCIQWPTVLENGFPAGRSYHSPPVHHRASLHWAIGLNITVFDTVAETCRQMSRPSQLGDMVSLLDTGGTLALCRNDRKYCTLDVWVLEDYDAETWGFQYRINLLAMEASPPLNLGFGYVPRMAVINKRELLIGQRPGRLLHCDIDGVFLGNVGNEGHESRLTLTMHRLQESIISLPLFEAQEEDAVNTEPPFSILL